MDLLLPACAAAAARGPQLRLGPIGALLPQIIRDHQAHASRRIFLPAILRVLVRLLSG